MLLLMCLPNAIIRIWNLMMISSKCERSTANAVRSELVCVAQFYVLQNCQLLKLYYAQSSEKNFSSRKYILFSRTGEGIPGLRQFWKINIFEKVSFSIKKNCVAHISCTFMYTKCVLHSFSQHERLINFFCVCCRQ